MPTRAIDLVTRRDLSGLTCCAVAVALRLLAGPRPIDDAYITFRYARNLARGLGLVYNPGQAVLGTSTPLFALMLGSLAALTPLAVPTAALVVSALADGVTALLLDRLALRLGLPRRLALACALTWCAYPLAFRYSIGGMETSVATALALGAGAAHLGRRAALAMALAGLAVLARPDMLAVAAVLLAARALDARRLPWREGLVLTAVLAPWLAFATRTYGSPVPQSLLAKSHAVYAVSPLENARQILYWLGGLLLSGPMDLAADGLSVYLTGGARWLAAGTGAVVLTAWLAGAAAAVRKDRRLAALFAIPLAFLAAYAVVGLRGSLMAEWYLVPLAPFLFLGLFSSADRAGRVLPGAALVAAVVLLGAQISGIEAVRGPGWGLAPRVARTEREELYRRAALFLRPELRPGDAVAASEIGAFGYYCECSVLDTVGLVSPEAVRYYPLPPASYAVNYAVPPALIRDAAPRFLVSLDVFTRRSLADAAWFRRDYERIWAADTGVFGSRALEVFRRRPQSGGEGRASG